MKRATHLTLMYNVPLKLNSIENSTAIIRRLEMIQDLKALYEKFNSLQVQEIDDIISTLQAEIVDIIAQDFGLV